MFTQKIYLTATSIYMLQGVQLTWKWIMYHLQNEGSKKTSHRNDSDEEAHAPKRDEADRSVVMFKPMVSDPIHIHRKSPLPRSRKIGSVEVSIYVPDNVFHRN